MEDTLTIVVDNSEENNNWQLIHKGKLIEQTHNPPGFNLICTGEKIYNFENI
jgi:hypothetical protein